LPQSNQSAKIKVKMDILGSIMKNMVQPPRMAPEERERRKKAEEMQKKLREAEQNAVLKFKENLNKRIEEFCQDEIQTRLTLEPMTRQQRGLVHEIAEANNLTAHSFGTEEIDRHVVIFKPEDIPTDTEMSCLKRGEVYDPKLELAKQQEELEESSSSATTTTTQGTKRKRNAQPEYLQKYEKHLGGLDVAKAGARSTETTRSYGYVPSEQKKDKRTIEETLADIQARKKGKTTTATTTPIPDNQPSQN
jgi:flagellar hook-basal body complex protein FliE